MLMGGACSSADVVLQSTQRGKRKRAPPVSSHKIIGMGLESYTSLNGTTFPIDTENSVRACSVGQLLRAIAAAKVDAEGRGVFEGAAHDLYALLDEVIRDLHGYGCGPERLGPLAHVRMEGVVHLVNHTFHSFHLDAHEHESVLHGAAQLSLGVPLGCLSTETAGLLIPGAAEVFTFSVPPPSASTSPDQVTMAEAEASTMAEAEASTMAEAEASTMAEAEASTMAEAEASCSAAYDDTTHLSHIKRNILARIGKCVVKGWRRPTEFLIDGDMHLVTGTLVNTYHIKQEAINGDGYCLLRSVVTTLTEADGGQCRAALRAIFFAAPDQAPTDENLLMLASEFLDHVDSGACLLQVSGDGSIEATYYPLEDMDATYQEVRDVVAQIRHLVATAAHKTQTSESEKAAWTDADLKRWRKIILEVPNRCSNHSDHDHAPATD